MGAVISLCDLTGNMTRPWEDAGHEALLIDPQHGKTRTEGGRTMYAGTILQALPTIREWIRTKNIVMVFGFPPCTDVSVSGAAWFAKKAEKDKHFQAKAALVAEQCRIIGELSGAPWFFENPVSVFSSIFGKPQHTFHPHQYTGHHPDDNYTKKTCLWTGNGFVMPPPNPDPTLGPPDQRMHYLPPSPNRANLRSATPQGFAKAVYETNNPNQPPRPLEGLF